MYLQGKLNQNAHITLRALQDWQQLNLSVKNLVKELKTFDLPVGKIIQSKRYLWHPAFLLLLHMQSFEILIFTRFYFCICCVCVFVGVHVRVCVCQYIYILYIQYILYAGVCIPVYVCDQCAGVFGGASVKGIVSKWQRGRGENDSYVCGLITINSPFDCNWCLNLCSPPPLARPLVPPSILSF